ncbi:hypothetical protein SAMN05216559_0422 [Halomicrobium zhouii]|uniref:Uncharacterized protein n=1 Tax=Halomicrobium zhouii TaxID=767519 RepID=A0A1I6K9G9_9EURY|nr:hypothetical protein SAMN05216559_0422 [Halomicrobium zhouii]
MSTTVNTSKALGGLAVAQRDTLTCVRVGPAERLPCSATPPRPFSPPGTAVARAASLRSARTRDWLRHPSPVAPGGATRFLTAPQPPGREAVSSADQGKGRAAVLCLVDERARRGPGTPDLQAPERSEEHRRSAGPERAEGFLAVGSLVFSSAIPTNHRFNSQAARAAGQRSTGLVSGSTKGDQTGIYTQKRSPQETEP